MKRLVPYPYKPYVEPPKKEVPDYILVDAMKISHADCSASSDTQPVDIDDSQASTTDSISRVFPYPLKKNAELTL